MNGTESGTRGTLEDLARALTALQGEGYSEYKRVKGRYRANRFDLSIDYVQGDPFAHPTRIRLFMPPDVVCLPTWTLENKERLRGASDHFHRLLYASLQTAPTGGGSGRSGDLDVLRPGQQVLERTAVLPGEGGALEVRMGVGLPADGRRILGEEARILLCETLPTALERALSELHGDPAALRMQVETVEDAVALRAQLAQRGLVAFLADGALLPRESGVADVPLRAVSVQPLRAPDDLAVTLEAPNAGPLRGLGIPAGVTLIVGGGYHGKSTLLRAIERGVYDHVPGDGRDRVVALPTAVKVRAEDGRSVAGTDISNFINDLPGGGRSDRFRSTNASGSTSQAASIIEALEVGARCLLLDEDTSAANFMIRDARMQRLIESRDEPITAFVDRAHELHAELGVSTVMVVGGSGDYFDVADTVIAMKDYLPRRVTDEARAIARALPSSRQREGEPWRPPAPRRVRADSIDPLDARGRVEVRLRSGQRVLFGREEVDLSAVEQIVEPAQMEAMARALIWARDQWSGESRELAPALREVMAAIERAGPAVVLPEPTGDGASFRIFELAAFLNRMRTLAVEDAGTRVAPPPPSQDD